MPFHRVDRPFTGAGVQRLPGEAVDPDAWRTGRRLVDQRYLSAGALTEAPTACPCGRLWVGPVPEHGCAATAPTRKRAG